MEYQYTPTKEKYGRRVYIGNYQGEELYLKPIKWDLTGILEVFI